MSEVDKLRDYRLGKLADVPHTLDKNEPNRNLQPKRWIVRFEFALIALRLEVKTLRPDGSYVMMTNRRKAPSPMTLFRKLGFKARSRVDMLEKVEAWASQHGMLTHGVKA